MVQTKQISQNSVPQLKLTQPICLVVAPYYSAITDQLIGGATKILQQTNAKTELIEVSGALEIPTAIRLASQHFSGFVALGCVIRGETSHYETVSTESSRALVDLGLCDICIGNGILTVENYTQAMIRADMSGQNKGGEAALASLMLIKVKNKFSKV